MKKVLNVRQYYMYMYYQMTRDGVCRSWDKHETIVYTTSLIDSLVAKGSLALVFDHLQDEKKTTGNRKARRSCHMIEVNVYLGRQRGWGLGGGT